MERKTKRVYVVVIVAVVAVVVHREITKITIRTNDTTYFVCSFVGIK